MSDVIFWNGKHFLVIFSMINKFSHIPDSQISGTFGVY